MTTLKSHVKTSSTEFQRSSAHHRALTAELRRRLEQVANAAPPQVVELQRKLAKFLVRERIERVLDPDTPFLELSALAATGLHGRRPSTGCSTVRRHVPIDPPRA